MAVITNTPPLFGPLEAQINVKTETRIGDVYYPLEKWFQELGCVFQGFREIPAINPNEHNVILYYKGPHDPENMAQILSESFEDNVFLQCVKEGL